MHTRGEHPVLPPKRLRLPAWHGMLFEQQHPLFAFGKRRSGG